MGTATLPKSDWLELDPVIWINYRNWTERALDQLDRVLYPPVKTKRDMVQRYQRGEFGNNSPSWDTLNNFSRYAAKWLAPPEVDQGEERFHLRNRLVGGETYYNLTARQVFFKWLQQEDKFQWYCSAMAPKHLLNGELMRTHQGLIFFLGFQLPKRIFG